MTAIIDPPKRPKAVEKYLSERNTAAAKARWANTTKKERSAHGKKMSNARTANLEKGKKWLG